MKWFLLLGSVAQMAMAAPPADTVFLNGAIHTGNDRQLKAEAIAVQGDRIVFVGSAAEAKAYTGAKTRRVDLRGRTVVPGLTDAHCHIFGVGERERTLTVAERLSSSSEDSTSLPKSHHRDTEKGLLCKGLKEIS